MKRLFVLFFFFLFLLKFSSQVLADGLPQNLQIQQWFEKGEVTQVLQSGEKEIAGQKNLFQVLKVKILDGKEAGKELTIQQGGDVLLSPQQLVQVGDVVVVNGIKNMDGSYQYNIYDTYRANTAMYIGIAFLLFVIFITGKKGIGALIGLTISLAVILGFIVPQILANHDPLTVTILGSFVILLLTTYLAHGFSKATSIAMVSSLTSLIITGLLSLAFVTLLKLAGNGSEDAVTLQLSGGVHVNLQGLLLSGIIIGTLGALNDVTTTQVASILALNRSNPMLKYLQLAEEGFTIGREHILSLVNTLVLAYAGSSLAIFIFFVLNPSHLPYWVIFNSQLLQEEFVRTIAGSIGLIVAVPISTFLAAWFVKRINIIR